MTIVTMTREEALAAVEELLAAHEKADNRDWEWEGRKVTKADPEDEEDEDHVYVPQGSYLGGSLIMLSDSQEGAAEDCDFVSAACRHAPWMALMLKELLK